MSCMLCDRQLWVNMNMFWPQYTSLDAAKNTAGKRNLLKPVQYYIDNTTENVCEESIT